MCDCMFICQYNADRLIFFTNEIVINMMKIFIIITLSLTLKTNATGVILRIKIPEK